MGAIIDVLIGIYKLGGRPAVQRALTIPQSQVKKITDKTKADFKTALEERDEAVEEFVEFIESLVLKGYEDPEDEPV